jgi:hypothetical protein
MKIVLKITRSSHPDFEYFGDLRRNGVQIKAYRFNSMPEIDARDR